MRGGIWGVCGKIGPDAQFVLRYGFGRSIDCRRFLGARVKVLQIVGIERPVTSDHLYERATFDNRDTVVRVPPESSYCVVHNTFGLKFLPRSIVGCDVTLRSDIIDNRW